MDGYKGEAPAIPKDPSSRRWKRSGFCPIFNETSARPLSSLERRHALVGTPTLNVPTLRGGTTQNVVSAECVVFIDRRVNPGEDHKAIVSEINDVLDLLRADGVTVAR